MYKYGDYPDVYFLNYLFLQSITRKMNDLGRILDLLPIGIMAVDKEGTIIYYNKAHAKIDGLSQKEVLGRNEAQVFGYPDLSPGIMRACQKMNRPILGFMCPYYTLKNRERIIEGSYWTFPLHDAQKEVMGSVCFTIQLTNNKNIFPYAGEQPLLWPESVPVSKITHSIIGENKQMLKAVKVAKNQANSPSPVLISGETGTGKELFARLIHQSSTRKNKAFIALNCAAIPSNLLEGILFGTTKGSFTGAIDKAGLFEEAEGGTLYLDEIDSMPLELQPKLLRVLQDMLVRRVGDNKEIKLDIKIISSVGENVQHVLDKKKLRPDLFYRLAVIVINILPLRERLDDIDDLLNHFIAKYNKTLGKKVLRFDQATRNWFNKYSWPGNVRELEHLVAGTINMADKTQILTFKHLPEHYTYLIEKYDEENKYLYHALMGNKENEDKNLEFNKNNNINQWPESHIKRYNPNKEINDKIFASDKTFASEETFVEGIKNAKEIFEKNEKNNICLTLKETKGQISKASKKLNISRQLLHYKMKKYNISRYEFLI